MPQRKRVHHQRRPVHPRVKVHAPVPAQHVRHLRQRHRLRVRQHPDVHARLPQHHPRLLFRPCPRLGLVGTVAARPSRTCFHLGLVIVVVVVLLASDEVLEMLGLGRGTVLREVVAHVRLVDRVARHRRAAAALLRRARHTPRALHEEHVRIHALVRKQPRRHAQRHVRRTVVPCTPVVRKAVLRPHQRLSGRLRLRCLRRVGAAVKHRAVRRVHVQAQPLPHSERTRRRPRAPGRQLQHRHARAVPKQPARRHVRLHPAPQKEHHPDLQRQQQPPRNLPLARTLMSWRPGPRRTSLFCCSLQCSSHVSPFPCTNSHSRRLIQGF